MAHEKDSDCTLDPETSVCTECGVGHGGPCFACEGRGFHKPWCPELEEGPLGKVLKLVRLAHSLHFRATLEAPGAYDAQIGRVLYAAEDVLSTELGLSVEELRRIQAESRIEVRS